MLFSPTMETQKSKNPELDALLPKNMRISNRKIKPTMIYVIYMYNTKTGDFLDKSFSKVLNYGDSLSDVADELIKRGDMYIKQTMTSPDIILDDPDKSTWFRKISNPIIHNSIIKGITFKRDIKGIFIYITDKMVARQRGSKKHILCRNVYELEACIEKAIKAINLANQSTEIAKSILIDERIYIKTDSRGVPSIVCNIIVPTPGNIQHFSKSRSLYKYSFDEALKQVREFRDMKIKELNLRPARPLTDVDIFNIQELKAKYDKLKPE